MALEITGKLFKILPEQTGSGKNGTWVKQDFVLETTTEQFPKKVCCSAWGDKVDLLRKFSPGEDIKVSFNIESREYNEKWYTDIRAWKIDSASGGGGGSQPSSGKTYKQSSGTDEPMKSADTFEGEEEDLPF